MQILQLSGPMNAEASLGTKVGGRRTRLSRDLDHTPNHHNDQFIRKLCQQETSAP